MDPVIGGALISAGSKLAGGLLGLAGAEKNNHRGREAREAVYNSVAQRVKAARDWGISPLYALGAATYSGAISTGGDNGLGSLGASLSDMGADIGRAVAAGQSAEERALQNLALQRAALENDYLKAQIGSINVRTAREVGPAVPSKPGLIPVKSADPQQTTGVNYGVPVRSNPFFVDAQTLEDRYGELGGSVLGLGNIPADLVYNAYLRWFGPGALNAADIKKAGYVNTGIRGGR